jgi:hypothetical protein
VQGSTSDKLGALGLDLDFVGWLEGASERLPHLNQLRRVPLADLAVALRAAAWLAQQVANPAVVQGDEAKNWLDRYRILQAFLVYSLKSTLMYSRQRRVEDLETLDDVMSKVFPSDVRKRYRDDIEGLIKVGLPACYGQDVKCKPTGGRPESEQSWRMRAAAEYVSQVSESPYLDLADFWNERRETDYQPDEIKDRLRKSVSPDEKRKRRVPGGEGALEFWRAIYEGDSSSFLPVRFPYSSDVPIPAGRKRLFAWPPI